jgi:hypothetical protein
MNSNCAYCMGLGWVCENHPHMAWSDEAGCQCGAGMLCECNRAEGHEEPDASQVIVEAAQIPFILTNAKKAKLRAIGYDVGRWRDHIRRRRKPRSPAFSEAATLSLLVV